MDQQPDDEAALKRRLLGRIAFAVVVLAGLLTSLAVFDSMNAPEPVTEKTSAAPPRMEKPAPKPADTINAQATRADGAGDAVASTSVASVPEESSTPTDTKTPATSGERPLTKPATGRLALMRSPEPAMPPPPRAEASRGAAPSPFRPSPPVSAPAGRETVPPAHAAPMVADKPFALQLGVFSDLANAEELRAKLEKAGIKATVEARVRVGPFATRAEADAARTKLRELGIAEALLVGVKSRKDP